MEAYAATKTIKYSLDWASYPKSSPLHNSKRSALVMRQSTLLLRPSTDPGDARDGYGRGYTPGDEG